MIQSDNDSMQIENCSQSDLIEIKRQSRGNAQQNSQNQNMNQNINNNLNQQSQVQGPHLGVFINNFNMFQNTEKQISQSNSKNNKNINQNKMMITSSNRQLNIILGGGLHYGMISQVYGQAGSGKTQLAMLFVIGALQRNQIAGYLSNQKELHLGRFLQLAYSAMNQAQYQEKQHLFIEKRQLDYDKSLDQIQQIMKKIRQSNNGGLLVIDSVYSLINACFEHYNIQKDNLQKSKKQAQFVNKIRHLAKISNCAVLLINHASDAFQKRKSMFGYLNQSSNYFQQNNSKQIIPALGPSWQLNIDQSFQLNKKGQVRQIMIVNSPKTVCDVRGWFRIQNQGFQWITRQGIQSDL